MSEQNEDEVIRNLGSGKSGSSITFLLLNALVGVLLKKGVGEQGEILKAFEETEKKFQEIVDNRES